MSVTWPRDQLIPILNIRKRLRKWRNWHRRKIRTEYGVRAAKCDKTFQEGENDQLCKRRAEIWELGGHGSPLGELFQGNGKDENGGI